MVFCWKFLAISFDANNNRRITDEIDINWWMLNPSQFRGFRMECVFLCGQFRCVLYEVAKVKSKWPKWLANHCPFLTVEIAQYLQRLNCSVLCFVENRLCVPFQLPKHHSFRLLIYMLYKVDVSFGLECVWPLVHSLTSPFNWKSFGANDKVIKKRDKKCQRTKEPRVYCKSVGWIYIFLLHEQNESEREQTKSAQLDCG